ncbi:hypothetical protein U91I_02785 [alpha proteobacterium U9-1i]|nr:hypothetical protein U91I_02785 [alpha proteobacterium U9-1i]
MRIFFSLSPAFAQSSEYDAGVRRMAKHFDLTPVFAHDAPAGSEVTEWISTSLEDCQFAFFDFTGLAADVLLAYGVATQHDVITHALVDHEKHRKHAGSSESTPLASALISKASRFHDADGFQRQAHMFLEARLGAKALFDKAFVSHIKETIGKKGPIYMRQLAQQVGRPMETVQPIVYELVRDGSVKKTGDTRWTRYSS